MILMIRRLTDLTAGVPAVAPPVGVAAHLQRGVVLRAPPTLRLFAAYLLVLLLYLRQRLHLQLESRVWSKK